MGSLEKDLLKRMEGYRYGRFNLINNNFKFKYDSKGNIEIKDFYKGDKFGEGDCIKLTRDFCKSNSHLNLVKVLGREPKYFNGEQDVHFYNLLLTKKISRNFLKLKGNIKKEIIKNSNSYVIDPSFNLVSPLKNSGYIFEKVFEDEGNISPNLSFKKEGEYYPLGINKKQELISIGIKKNKPIIKFQKSFDTEYYDYIHLEETSRMRGNLLFEEDLQSICVNLSKKYVEFKEKNLFKL